VGACYQPQDPSAQGPCNPVVTRTLLCSLAAMLAPATAQLMCSWQQVVSTPRLCHPCHLGSPRAHHLTQHPYLPRYLA
jgi:hypothetical protein